MGLSQDLSREEMIALVHRIFRADGGEAEADADVELFIANCKHPAGSDLIFWPHDFPHDPSKPQPTVEQIIDRAMMSGEG